MSSLPISTENLVRYYDTISSANGTIDRFFFLVAHLNLKPWKIRIILSLSREDISVFLEHRLYFRGVPRSFKTSGREGLWDLFRLFFYLFYFCSSKNPLWHIENQKKGKKTGSLHTTKETRNQGGDLRCRTFNMRQLLFLSLVPCRWKQYSDKKHNGKFNWLSF